MSVHILMKHPRHPYHAGHLEAGVIVGVYADKRDAQEIAKAKNGRSSYLYSVHTKRIKGQA